MQAGATYTNAFRDYMGQKYDLAMQEFSDYLKYFPKTDFAPNAQFYIGDIYYRKGDLITRCRLSMRSLNNIPKTPRPRTPTT